MLVKDVMRIPQRKITSKDIGLEIEVEGRDLPIPPAFWRCDRDGSLRGEESMEYVLDAPMNLKGVNAALVHLKECYKANKTRVDESVRAGVHVHINCQHLTLTELYCFITLYLVLENILLKFCGKWREGNLFCLRCKDAEWLLYRLVQAAKTKRLLECFHDDNMRYGSMNVKALGDYGSLEFRAMRSTKDFGAIEDWVTILYQLREAAKEFKSPVQIIEQVSQVGPKTFLSRCLGDYAGYFNVLPEVSDLLYEGVELAQCVAYSVNWDKWDQARIIGNVEFPDDGIYYNEPIGDQ